MWLHLTCVQTRPYLRSNREASSKIHFAKRTNDTERYSDAPSHWPDVSWRQLPVGTCSCVVGRFSWLRTAGAQCGRSSAPSSETGLSSETQNLVSQVVYLRCNDRRGVIKVQRFSSVFVGRSTCNFKKLRVRQFWFFSFLNSIFRLLKSQNLKCCLSLV